MKILGFLFAFITLSIFSIDTVAMKILLTDTEISSVWLSFLRYFLASLFLGIIYIIFFYIKDKKNVKILLFKKNILKDKIFWWTILSMLFSITLFHYGLEFTSASNSVLIQTLSPVILMLLILFFFPHQLSKNLKTRKIFIIVITASLWSSVLLSGSILDFWLSSKIYGDIVQFLSMILFWAFLLFNSELRNKYKNYNPIFITSLLFTCASFILLPFWFSYLITILDLSVYHLLLLLFVSIWSTAIAYLSWFLAAKYISSLTLGLLINIIWVTTVFFEYYIYKDSSLIGGNIILWWLIIIWVSIYIEYLNSKK